MEKINFENLPSENTPINQDNLNLMQGNIEKSVVAVSLTEPSTNEKVWIKKGKNWFDNTFYQIRNGRFSNIRIESKKVTIKDKINIPQAITLSNDLDLNTYKWAVNIKTDRGTIDYDSDWIITNSWTISQSEISEYVLRGNAEIYFVVAKLDDSDINVSEMDNYNFQIEVGTTATSYEPYINKEILTKNDNNIFEKFYSENVNYKWEYATLSSYVGGTVIYVKIGNLVIVQFDDFWVEQNISSSGTILASGLPKSNKYIKTELVSFTYPLQAFRVAINEEGNIVAHYSERNVETGTNFYGSLIYLTD